MDALGECKYQLGSVFFSINILWARALGYTISFFNLFNFCFFVRLYSTQHRVGYSSQLRVKQLPGTAPVSSGFCQRSQYPGPNIHLAAWRSSVRSQSGTSARADSLELCVFSHVSVILIVQCQTNCVEFLHKRETQ